jgi:hypothetical protein
MFPICNPFELYHTIQVINSTCDYHRIGDIFDGYVRYQAYQLHNIDKKTVNIHIQTLVHYGWSMYTRKNDTFVAKVEIPDWSF